MFNQSTQSVSVNVSIADDMIFEGTEVFQASLTLVDPFIPTIITVSPSLANISIEDDDSKLTLTLQYVMVQAVTVLSMKAAYCITYTTSLLTMVPSQPLSLDLKWKGIQLSNQTKL